MRADNHTDMGGLRQSFLTTHWSLIEDLQERENKDQALIGLLLERYWKPVYCYLRRKGYQNEESKDLTQAFFHEVVLNRGLVNRAERSKGRFRSFLLHALDQFLIDQRRRESAKKRIPQNKLVSLDVGDAPQLPETVLSRTAEECFVYAWKSELLDRTLGQVQADCERLGLQIHWCIFRDKVLHPTLDNEESQSMKIISDRYGIDSESKAFNMLLTIKRRFKATLRANLRNTVAAEEYVDEEWHEMLNLFREIEQKEP